MAALVANANGFKTLQQLACRKIIKDQSNITLLKNEMGYVGSVEFIYCAIRSLRSSGGWKSVHQYIRKILYSIDLGYYAYLNTRLDASIIGLITFWQVPGGTVVSIKIRVSSVQFSPMVLMAFLK